MAGGGRGRDDPGRTGSGRRRGPRWARIMLALGVVLTVLGGGTVVALNLVVHEVTSGITRTSLLPEEAVATGAAAKNIDGPINLLLVGIDVRQNWDAGARSDTMIIVHVPASHDRAYLISIPRDWRVKIPADKKSGYPGGTTKINAAFEFGYQGSGTEIEKRARGFSLLARTLHARTGITFNGAAIIDFQGFSGVIEELGGVRMRIDQRAESIHLAYDRNGKLVHTSFDENTHVVSGIPPGGHRVVYQKGTRNMSAELALDYARIRYGLPRLDYDRQRHQQQLIKAIVDKATSKGVIANPLKLKRVLDAAGKAFVLDLQGVSIEDFVFTLKSIRPDDLVTLKTNGGTFNEVKIDGVSYQDLTDDSMQMLHAVRDGTLAGFVQAHQEVISSDPV